MLRIKHPTDVKSGHSHTTLLVKESEDGRFWLSALCSKSGCNGHTLIELLPAQVEQWEISGIGERIIKEDVRQQQEAA
jgi:hypothetical protein